jgi:hypothetical protein
VWASIGPPAKKANIVSSSLSPSSRIFWDPAGSEAWVLLYARLFCLQLLTVREYKRVENAYVKLALAFRSESRIATVRVVGLENSRRPKTD